MKHEHGNSSLSWKIESNTGVKSARCYQCGKCSAGCPMAQDMDYTPSAFMRSLQIEDETTDLALLQSESIWLCLTCEMCISRCPMSVDIPKMMDYLREEALSRGVQHSKADKTIVNFHQSFMNMVRLTGRSFEIGLVIDYKRRSLNLFQDIALAPGMLLRGKLPLMPDSLKNIKEIAHIFKATKNKSNSSNHH